MINVDIWRRALAEEQARLERELTGLAIPDPHMKGDWDARFPVRQPGETEFSHVSLEEQADLREEFETNIAQEHSLESRLAEVTNALARIEQGTFGMCRACNKPISEERLAANPAAEYDIEHQPKE